MIALKWHSKDLKYEIEKVEYKKLRNIDLINKQMEDLNRSDETSAIS